MITSTSPHFSQAASSIATAPPPLSNLVQLPSLFPISKSSVRAHLMYLGWRELPEDLISEFTQELEHLEKQLQKKHHHQPAANQEVDHRHQKFVEELVQSSANVNTEYYRNDEDNFNHNNNVNNFNNNHGNEGYYFQEEDQVVNTLTESFANLKPPRVKSAAPLSVNTKGHSTGKKASRAQSATGNRSNQAATNTTRVEYCGMTFDIPTPVSNTSSSLKKGSSYSLDFKRPGSAATESSIPRYSSSGSNSSSTASSSLYRKKSDPVRMFREHSQDWKKQPYVRLHLTKN